MKIFNKELTDNDKKISELLDNFIKNLNLNLDLQFQYKNLLTIFMQKISNYPTDDINNNDAKKILDFLESLKETVNLYNTNIIKLNSLQSTYNSIKSKTDITTSSLDDFFNNYNNILDEVLENSIKISTFFNSASKFFEETFTSYNSNNKEIKNNTSNVDSLNATPAQNSQVENNTNNIDNSDNNDSTDNTNNSTDNILNTILKNNENYKENTLIISETQKKVFLPYTLSELENTFKNNQKKYYNYNYIIEDEYTLPYRHFRNPSISRFKEAYNLVRNKEHGTVKEAFELGMELLFNYNLHPAIIAACRNLDELDIYLDCLDCNETNQFKCFNIIFEIAPIVSKRRAYL